MNWSGVEIGRVPDAVAGAECWISSIRGNDGYYGPAIGPERVSVRYCGPAFDWRYEGLLDGFCHMHRATGHARYLDWVARDLEEMAANQLPDGAFRNSYFEFNPFEGGMPHEPAVVAAACRARQALCRAGHQVPRACDAMLERFVERRLLNELWNRLLRTFNDWLQSDFEWYTPHAVAACIELLAAYADLTGARERLAPYIEGAARSITSVQQSRGPLAGAIPVSNRPGSPAAPALAARCLPALTLTAERTGDDAYRRAADALADFVRRHARAEGGFPHQVRLERPAEEWPVLPGAAAGALNAMARAGLLAAEDLGRHIPFLLDFQTTSGAFRTGLGFGGRRGRIPDWRDAMPVCGWNDKIYALLASLHPNLPGRFEPREVDCDVAVRGRPALLIESATELAIRPRRGDTPLYHWVKRERWARECRL